MQVFKQLIKKPSKEYPELLLRDYAPGDLVHWVKSEQQWNTQIRAICKPFEPFNFPLPDAFTQATSYLMCKKYSATMTVITSLEMQRDLFSHLQRLFGNETKSGTSTTPSI